MIKIYQTPCLYQKRFKNIYDVMASGMIIAKKRRKSIGIHIKTEISEAVIEIKRQVTRLFWTTQSPEEIQ